MKKQILFFSFIFLIFIQLTYCFVEKPELKWKKGGCYSAGGCETGWYASPVITEDGDVLGSQYNIFRLDGNTGNIVWRTKSGHEESDGTGQDVSNKGRTWPDLIYSDIDGDSDNDLATGHGNGYFSVYNAKTGDFLDKGPFTKTDSEIRSIVSCVLDSNKMNPSGEEQDLLLGIAQGTENSMYAVKSTNGDTIFKKKDDGDSYAWGIYGNNIAVGLDNNDKKVIFVPTDVHYIQAYYIDGEPVMADSDTYGDKEWGQVGAYAKFSDEKQGFGDCDVKGETFRANFARGAVLIDDLDNDGNREIVAIGNFHDCGDGAKEYWAGPFIFNFDRTRWSNNDYDWTDIPEQVGEPLFQEDYNVIELVSFQPATADLDGDGEKEIIYSSYDGKVHAFWLDKEEKHSWPYSLDQSDSFTYSSPPVVVDIDNDGKAEVIVGTWTAKSTDEIGQLIVLNHKGQELYKIDLPESPTSYDGILASPTLGNIDNDDDLEVVVSTARQGLVAYDLPGSEDAVIHFQTGKANYQRNGYVPEVIVVNPPVTITTEPETTTEPTETTEPCDEADEDCDDDFAHKLQSSLILLFISMIALLLIN